MIGLSQILSCLSAINSFNKQNPFHLKRKKSRLENNLARFNIYWIISPCHIWFIVNKCTTFYILNLKCFLYNLVIFKALMVKGKMFTYEDCEIRLMFVYIKINLFIFYREHQQTVPRLGWFTTKKTEQISVTF